MEMKEGDKLAAEQRSGHSSGEKLYQISEDFVLRQIGGEYAIIPIGETSSISNAVMSPNDSAVFLWKQFMEPNSEEKVIAKVLEEYEAPEEKVEDDVHRFIQESLRRQILKEVD